MEENSKIVVVVVVVSWFNFVDEKFDRRINMLGGSFVL